MMTSWVHLIGFYLVLGFVIQGLGTLVKVHWVRIGKIPPPWRGKNGKLIFVAVSVLAVFIWPASLVGIAIAWKLNKDGKVEKFLGHCEHATAFEPICWDCRKKLEPKKSGQTRYRVGLSDAEIKARSELAKHQQRMMKQAQKPQNIVSEPVRVDLNRPVIKSCYECSSCGKMGEGFPPHANADGKPLCGDCSIGHNRFFMRTNRPMTESQIDELRKEAEKND